jgi:hypothetical protein
MWSWLTLMLLYMNEYSSVLFARLQEMCRRGNVTRIAVGANNPHVATRKVATDVNAAIDTMSLARDCIATAPKLEGYIVEVEAKAQAASRLQDMLTDDAEAKLKDMADAPQQMLGVRWLPLSGCEHSTVYADAYFKRYSHLPVGIYIHSGEIIAATYHHCGNSVFVALMLARVALMMQRVST